MPPFPNQAAPQPVSNGGPMPEPPGPEQGNGGGRLAQLAPEELELLKSDPVVVELIKKIAPEVAGELDALVGQAQPQGEGEAPAMSPPSPQPSRMAAPSTQLGRM